MEIIPTNCFSGTKLNSVIIPEGVKTIGTSAFNSCTSLEYLTLSSTVEYINSSSFSYCNKLTSVVISSSVKEIGSYAFSNCSALKNVIIPSSVKIMGSYAFTYCSSLTGVNVPSSIRTISECTFEGCTSLSNVVLNYGLKEINRYAFSSCRQLTSVTIPSSVYSIATNCFYDCQMLTGVIFENADGWYNSNNENVYKEVLQSPELAYQQMKNNSDGSYYGVYWSCRIVATNVYSIGATSLTVGSTKTLSAMIEPETATSQITYTSMNESIATVDETGKVTALSSGSTTIIVESAGTTAPVDVIVGNKIYALNASLCSTNWRYSDTPYQVTTNQITWLNNGRFYRMSGWYSTNAMYSEGGDTRIENLNEISGVSKVMISYFMDPTEEKSRYFDEYNLWVYTGNTQDNLKRVSLNISQTRILYEKTSYTDGNGRNALKYSVSFDVPAGCGFFAFEFKNWAVIQEIAFF